MVPGDNSAVRLPTTLSMPTDGFQKVVRDEVRYPARLLRIRRPPQQIWFRGALPRPEQPAAAIVGSRKASGAGCERGHELAGALARQGRAVNSGGALGVDVTAHRGAPGDG